LLNYSHNNELNIENKLNFLNNIPFNILNNWWSCLNTFYKPNHKVYKFIHPNNIQPNIKNN